MNLRFYRYIVIEQYILNSFNNVPQCLNVFLLFNSFVLMFKNTEIPEQEFPTGNSICKRSDDDDAYPRVCVCVLFEFLFVRFGTVMYLHARTRICTTGGWVRNMYMLRCARECVSLACFCFVCRWHSSSSSIDVAHQSRVVQ